MVGAPLGGNYKGYTYIIYGSATMADDLETTYADLESASRVTRLAYSGSDGDPKHGYSVSGIGDFNGDGKADVIIGAGQSHALKGAAYIILGTDSLGATEDLDALVTAEKAIKILGGAANNYAGTAVAGHFDFNNDGKEDVVVSEPRALNGKGRVTIIYGYTPSASADYNIDLGTYSNGFQLIGPSTDSLLGYSVWPIGNFNGDSYDDIAIESFLGISGTADYVYIVCGRADTTSSGSPFDMSTIQASDNIYSVSGFTQSDLQVPRLVSSAGKFNDDDLDDLVIGDFRADSNKGAAYIIFGSQSFPTTVAVSSMGTNGIKITAPQSTTAYFGHSVANIGDFDGDGFDDVAIGAPEYVVSNSNNEGRVYIVYGSASPTNLDADTMVDAGDGGVIIAETSQSTGELGYSVSGNYDLDGDGTQDILIGAPGVDYEFGRFYVVTGKSGVRKTTITLDAFDLFIGQQ